MDVGLKAGLYRIRDTILGLVKIVFRNDNSLIYRRPKPGEKIITSPAFIKDEPGKEHGRPCVAYIYMHINHATMNNGYPIRDPEKLIRKMRRKHSLILDLKTGDNRITPSDSHPMQRDSSRSPHKTESSSLLVCDTRMTFGSKNAPSHFCSCTDYWYVLKDIEEADPYIDDINTAHDEFREFISALARVLTQLKRYNLQFNRKKLQVCAKVPW